MNGSKTEAFSVELPSVVARVLLMPDSVLVIMPLLQGTLAMNHIFLLKWQWHDRQGDKLKHF